MPVWTPPKYIIIGAPGWRGSQVARLQVRGSEVFPEALPENPQQVVGRVWTYEMIHVSLDRPSIGEGTARIFFLNDCAMLIDFVADATAHPSVTRFLQTPRVSVRVADASDRIPPHA